jgi:hypothetical protein
VTWGTEKILEERRENNDFSGKTQKRICLLHHSLFWKFPTSSENGFRKISTPPEFQEKRKIITQKAAGSVLQSQFYLNTVSYPYQA